MRPPRTPIATAALAISLLSTVPALGAIGSWQFPPTDLSPYGEGGGVPSVVINPAADATAIWSSSGVTPSLMRERTWTAGAWGPDTALSVGPFNTSQPHLAGNASGALSAVWRIIDGGTKRVQAATRAGGGWGAPTTLTPGSDDYEFPTAVIDSSGVTTAAWVRDDGSDTYVQWARNAGGTWSGPTDLSPAGGGDVQLAVDGSGVVTAIWEQGFAIQARRFSGGAWGSVDTLDPGGSQQPAIVADGSGVLTAVWSADPGSGIRVIRSSRFTGAGWSTPTPISITGQDSTSVELAVDASGAVTAVWRANTGANFLIVAARLVNGNWTTGTKISQAGQDAARPSVASGPAGSALATWERSDGTNQRIQAAEFSSGAWEEPITLSPAGVSATSGGATVAMSPSGAAVTGWALGAPAPTTQAIRYVPTPAPASAAGGASPLGPNSSATKSRKKLPGSFVLNRKTRVGTTTGTVPAGITRITQSAKASKTKRSKAKSATGRCRITTVRNKKTKKVTKRTFRCTITLPKATWTVTTLGYTGAEVVAEGVRTVSVKK